MSSLAVIVGVVLVVATGLGVFLWAMCAAASAADDQAERNALVDRREAIAERLAADLAEAKRRRALRDPSWSAHKAGRELAQEAQARFEAAPRRRPQ